MIDISDCGTDIIPEHYGGNISVQNTNISNQESIGYPAGYVFRYSDTGLISFCRFVNNTSEVSACLLNYAFEGIIHHTIICNNKCYNSTDNDVSGIICCLYTSVNITSCSIIDNA